MRRLLLVVLILGLAGCSEARDGAGILHGHVSVGPLVPVVREGMPTPTPAPEVYAGRMIIVLAKDGRTRIAQATIDGRGNYSIALPAGSYVVDSNHLGMDRGIGLPATVEIRDGQATRLDVDIDTGIR